MVLAPAAGDRYVEQLPGFSSAQDSVAGVDGLPLRAVEGGGVAELDVFAGVVGRQRDPPVRAGMPHVQRSVGPDRGDGPPFAVRDEVGDRERGQYLNLRPLAYEPSSTPPLHRT